MMSYKDFCHELAEVIVGLRELTNEEYEEWRKLVPELAGEHSAIAKKVVEIADSYRSRYFMA